MLVICHQNSWYPCCYYICVHISLEFECSLRLFAYELVGMQLLTLKGWSFYSLAYSRGSQTLRPALILGLGHLAFVQYIISLLTVVCIYDGEAVMQLIT